jgi:serine/threonine-protein kinase
MTPAAHRLANALAERYRLERELGRGGMATVWLAGDVRHRRRVAIKVLHPELSAVLGPERFLREIELTASLQHPNILPLFDSGSAKGLLYYVMPYVDGETLRRRLERERQLAIGDAVRIATEVADALDYAHARGVIHRDIKPENILLQHGHALVADFGIALAVEQAAASRRLTQAGLSLGTPEYMAPEQAMGDRELDARTDVYALGVVTYEMLAGAPPFTGPTASAIVAKVLTEEPQALTVVRRTVPAPVEHAVHTALARLPADRFPSAAHYAAALAGGPSAPGAAVRPRRRRSAVGLGVGLAIGLAAGALARPLLVPAARPEPRRWSIELPAAAPVALAGPSLAMGWQTAIALSPDGDRLAYVVPHASTTVLAVRSLESDAVATLPGTEGAYHPFFSPDGAWIGFFSGTLLRKVRATGGTPETLAEVNRISGAAWVTADRLLVLEQEGFVLRWISASGSASDSALHLSTQFGSPHVLPGGAWAVGHLGSGQLALLSLADGRELAITRRGVLPLGAVRQGDLLFGVSPHWLAPGYLVYGAGDGVLTAMPFDARRLAVTGQPVPVATGMRMEAGFGYAELAISREGTLAYVPGGNQFYASLAFVTPQGRIDTLPIPRGTYTQPRISPDGTRLAVQARNPVGAWQLLLVDLATGVRRELDVGGNYRPFPASWLPSGRELMIGLWDPVQTLNYGARIQSVETGRFTDLHLPGASYMTVAPDGRSFVFSDWRSGDLYLRSLTGDTTRTRIPARGFAASFSPDGRWLAWGSVNGALEVSPVPPSGAIYTVAERGKMPVWTPDGDALVYRDGSRYYRLPVSTDSGFRAGRPALLVEGAFLETFAWNHAIAPDGRLLVLLTSPEREARALRVITAFPSLVERLAGAK